MAVTQGFVLGLVGSLHCIAMCGPIAIMLPAGGGARVSFLTGRVLYNLGRVLTYSVLELGAGVVGRVVMMAGYQQGLSIVLGSLIVLGVLGPAVFKRVLSNARGTTRLQILVKSAFRSFLRQRSLVSLALIGVANGFLPCGLVYVALAAAATPRQDCPNVLLRKDKERFLQVGWGKVEHTFPVHITVKAYDRRD